MFGTEGAIFTLAWAASRGVRMKHNPAGFSNGGPLALNTNSSGPFRIKRQTFFREIGLSEAEANLLQPFATISGLERGVPPSPNNFFFSRASPLT